MDIQIVHGPGNAAARVALDGGETVTTEGGAMIAMSSDLTVTTTTHKKGKGGILKAAKRLLGGESFFLNHYEAGSQGGEIWLSTPLPGDMKTMEIDGAKLIVQAGSFVAAAHGVDVDTGWQGFKNLLSGEGLFWLSVGGQGSLVVNSFGAIYPIDVDGEYIVDSGHIIAFDETLDFKLSKAGSSWLHSFLGGEGMVCRFHGKGRVWCQSHHPKSFGMSLRPFLKPA